MPAGPKSQTVRPAAMKCTKAFEGLAQFTSLAFMAAHKDKDFMPHCMTYDGKDSKNPFQNLFLTYYTKCMYLTKFMLNSFTFFFQGFHSHSYHVVTIKAKQYSQVANTMRAE